MKNPGYRTAVGVLKWALLDSNNPPSRGDKGRSEGGGAAKGAAKTPKLDADGDLAAALRMLDRLPLSDAERAEALRRLLDGEG